MIGALWTGISGLASHQTALDNESHNISNVNTVGYKASRISFADQMYQDRIGKGSKVLDAEKLYVQGNLKLTGVDYDLALSGDGFFTVLNTRTSGTSENLYTRAGNFRMGDNGTLQDAAGNEVQGWAMRSIDTNKDVVSTNPNVDMFTNDYTKLLTSKVVSHSNYIETITAKATDYSQLAKADSESVFSGAGGKSKSAKISDVEALVSSYSSWLQKLKDDPDGGSASSTAQISQINFKSYDKLDNSAADAVDSGLISKEGDQIFVFIDGNKVSQNYISVTASSDLNNDGTTDDTDHKIASRIETYKSLADKISEIPGLRAYMAAEGSTGTDDVLETDDSFTLSTSNADMIKGIIQIESLVPGETFTITEVGEISNNNTIAGAYQTGTAAVQGTGIGALESARDALSEAISGKQQDVYTTADLELAGTIPYEYSMTIYDKELEKIIPVPNDNGVPPQAVPITIDPTNGGTEATVDSFIAAFNTAAAASNPNLLDYVEALNINGNLVIQTKDDNFDVEFSGNMQSYNKTMLTGTTTSGVSDTYADSVSSPDGAKDYVYMYELTDGTTGSVTITNPADWPAIATAINAEAGLTADHATTTASTLTVAGLIASGTLYEVDTELSPLDKNNDYSGRAGAGAEFIELVNTIDQTTTQSSLQLRLDTLGISDSAFGEFSVDSAGVITMKQDGAEFAIGQVSIALFNNNRGLNPSGDNLLAKTNESGEPIYNLNNDKTAKIEGQTLELSTADLSESLVNLMVFQRAFEANAKSITTSDQLLNTLINLKR
ncbi:flagellar hook-basal body complex protein [Arcobacter sp. LA11]|uniref:flagellar hook-basal body complex protein n=1 Tax=Arcobacter sp. LA11 TaxID=1898176 RepID=UPI000932596E|nr:flagellar hook-basal body complex protein [Arcobacter sp. LA11]